MAKRTRRRRVVLGMGPDFIAQLQKLGGPDTGPDDGGSDGNQQQVTVAQTTAPGPVRMGTKMPLRRKRAAPGTTLVVVDMQVRKGCRSAAAFSEFVDALNAGKGKE